MKAGKITEKKKGKQEIQKYLKLNQTGGDGTDQSLYNHTIIHSCCHIFILTHRNITLGQIKDTLLFNSLLSDRIDKIYESKEKVEITIRNRQ